MSTISISPDVLSVRFSRAEKLMGLVRDVDVPLQLVVSVTVVEAALAAASGLRAPGLALPGRRKLGTWRRRGQRPTLVDVRRGQAAVEVKLSGHRYSRLLIGSPDAVSVAEQINAAASAAATRG